MAKLIAVKESGERVERGDVVHTKSGVAWRFQYATRVTGGGSTGKVVAERLDELDGSVCDRRELFAHVLGLKVLE